MRHPRRIRAVVEFPHLGLDRQVRARHALVLAHVLEPALDHEHFEVAARRGGVDEVMPVDRAVAAADVRVGRERRGKGGATSGATIYSTVTRTGPRSPGSVLPATTGAGQCRDGRRSRLWSPAGSRAT